MTKRLIRWIADNGTTATFAALSKESGLDIATISAVFTAASARIITGDLVQSGVIAIEGFLLVGQIRPILYASRSKQLLDIAQDVEELVLGDSQWRCERLIMPPTREYQTLQTVVRWQTLVIGRQSLLDHADLLMTPKIEQMLRDAECPATDSRVFFRAPETLRRVARRRVRHWHEHCPLVAQAYSLKVEFSNIWHLSRNDRNRASDYDLWRTAVMNSDEAVRQIFQPVCNEIDRQYTSVFRFYDDPRWREDESGARWARYTVSGVKRTHSFYAAAEELLQSRETR